MRLCRLGSPAKINIVAVAPLRKGIDTAVGGRFAG